MKDQIKLSQKFIEDWFSELGFTLYQVGNNSRQIEYYKLSVNSDWYIQIGCADYLRKSNDGYFDPEILVTANQFRLTLIKYRKKRLLQTMNAFYLIQRIPFTISDDDLVFIKKIITKMVNEN